ncbi:outer membrane beta-barrel protein [Aquimarina sp. ERC-38]|uniref:TonB-dependent receptor n=1 Tax=Aquimarina sp. ERC-38 TaxID=2949996 RepID=UPI0022480FFC|nr:TonB-dependent receptor [Aquimarina sp. ERC-38]UZO81588.1 outer membrane beta-barrel protein [Aquimarina sp. ERC-38]
MLLKSKLFTGLLILFLITPLFSFSQGKITGKILDGETNDILPFANITIKGTTIGSTSDFDGFYELSVDEPGVYTVIYSFVGYETKEISEIEITSDSDVKEVNVTLNASAAQLEDVVITTTVRKNTEQAVLTLQKNSVKLLDGLSIESIKTTGASDIASAVKNVPGVSVQGGKFVYVRGLGDRYTKSILNGSDVPGLDPDRNTLQLDIFPTNILENILVVKSSTADQPADFTGGVVDIITKDFPSREEYSVSGGFGYNSNMHFNNDYLNYEGGNTDFLGFDDGTRDNPLRNVRGTLLTPQENGLVARQYVEQFDPTLAPERNNSFANFSLGFTAGKQFTVGNNKLGYLASLSYKNESIYYDEYIDAQVYRKDDQDFSNNELITDRTQQGELASNNVLISGLVGLSYKREFSKYKLNILHLQNGQAESSTLRLSNFSVNSNQIKKDNLEYTQRSITNLQLSGEHSNQNASWNFDWKLSPSFARVYDKDIRSTPLRIENNADGSTTFSLDPSEAQDPVRIWRDLEEINLASKLDISNKHQMFNKEATLRFGFAQTYKQRDFTIDRFNFLARRFATFSESFEDGNSEALLAPANLYNPETRIGIFVRRDAVASDNFDSSANVSASYISEEFKFSNQLNAIVGVRFEKYDLVYTGINQNNVIFDDENILDKADFFPSANIIYDLNKDGDHKLRVSYSRTTARPSFKEASIAQIFDPVNSTFFIGNINIQPTYINNFDLRYEHYGEGADFFAISGFYKSFKDPIELSFIRAARDQFTPLNLGDATVLGAEIEFRKNLGFIIGLDNFNLNTNISVIESNQNFSEDEKNARRDNLRDGEDLPDGRTLQGQSPYLINLGINYDNENNGFKAGVFYNVQGETLQIVGNGDVPDVFTLPFHSLNLSLGKSFGKENNSSMTLKFNNILNDDRESAYQSFGAEDQLFSRWSPGQEISLSYSYKF